MKITVIVCTYNRGDCLAKTLESLAASVVSSDWEVLVVDNNSTDRTREIVAGFTERDPAHFRYLFEPRQGKSYALNSGIQQASGEILAFTDDDVVVRPTWIEKLTAGLRSGEWAGASGRTLPNWQSPPPKWLRVEARYALAPFAIFDLGEAPQRLLESPFGANMAFRRTMFEKHGTFLPDLAGLDGLFRNEDTEFGNRLLAAGEMLRYEPAAVAFHPVSAQRLDRQYLLKWWYDKGRADVRESGFSPDYICVLGVPLCFFRRALIWSLRGMLTLSSQRRFDCQWRVHWNLGKAAESYDERRRSGKKRAPGTVSDTVGH